MLAKASSPLPCLSLCDLSQRCRESHCLKHSLSTINHALIFHLTSKVLTVACKTLHHLTPLISPILYLPIVHHGCYAQSKMAAMVFLNKVDRPCISFLLLPGMLFFNIATCITPSSFNGLWQTSPLDAVFSYHTIQNWLVLPLVSISH
jgi:hypothetical protein